MQLWKSWIRGSVTVTTKRRSTDDRRPWRIGRPGTEAIESVLSQLTLFRLCPSTSTNAKVEMDGRSCRELLEGRAHSRSLGYARDDKVEGGGHLGMSGGGWTESKKG